ncbi:hypothetical protein [Streptosporangium sp. LJ11]|uniref:hypothetical protein n=1 Tax=Streptosporangium sp. LJ11 TaxID=3436927 RepID=UPI003F797EC3
MAVHRTLKDLVLMLAVTNTSFIVFTFFTALVFKDFFPPDAFEATLDMGPGLWILLVVGSLSTTVGFLLTRRAKSKSQPPAGGLRLRDDRQQQERSS